MTMASTCGCVHVRGQDCVAPCRPCPIFSNQLGALRLLFRGCLPIVSGLALKTWLNGAVRCRCLPNEPFLRYRKSSLGQAYQALCFAKCNRLSIQSHNRNKSYAAPFQRQPVSTAIEGSADQKRKSSEAFASLSFSKTERRHCFFDDVSVASVFMAETRT